MHIKLNRICPDANLTQGLGFVVDRRIVAGVTYHNWNGFDVEAAVAIEPDFQWSRPALRAIFAYPFEQLGARRMTARIEHDNAPSRAFVERLGFMLEATLAEACKAGDLLIYRLMRRECRWIE